MKLSVLLVGLLLLGCTKMDLSSVEEAKSSARLSTAAEIVQQYGVPGKLPDIKILKGEYGWTTSTGWLGIESQSVFTKVADEYDATEYGFKKDSLYKFWSFRCPFANVAPYSREGLYDWTLIQSKDGTYNPSTGDYYYDGIVEYETYVIQNGYGRLFNRNDKFAFFPNYPYTKVEVKGFIFQYYDDDTLYMPGGGTADIYVPRVPVPQGSSEIVEVITADPHGHWTEYNNNTANNRVAVGADVGETSAVLDESNIERAKPEPVSTINYSISGKGRNKVVTLSWNDVQAGEYCVATPTGEIIEDIYGTTVTIPVAPKFKSGTFHVKSMNPGIGDSQAVTVFVR